MNCTSHSPRLAMLRHSLPIGYAAGHPPPPPAFLALFDDVARYINQRYDLRSTDLATLIVTIHQNGGKLSSNRRKRFADRVQSHVLDAIEAAVARRMDGLPLSEPEDED